MSNISIEELEKKVEVGEEVIDPYFDVTTAKVGVPRPMTARRRSDLVAIGLDIPSPMLDELDRMASELYISRQAAIKILAAKLRLK